METFPPDQDRSSRHLRLIASDATMESRALLEALQLTGALLVQPSISSSRGSASVIEGISVRLCWLVQRYDLDSQEREFVAEWYRYLRRARQQRQDDGPLLPPSLSPLRGF